ncbi:MAG: HupE/UreJ family protein [Leptolyngbyaceae cyanobacterium SU_3_3]|nr:HupE/UreJ family protein [Leptolyngbyaceae cyanobacterium SU_3_3]
MNQFKISRFDRSSKALRQTGLLAALMFALSLVTTPALAHHAMDGKMPSNLLEGFMAGMAHPLIGPDHFAFIVAVGLLAAARKQGILIPIAFVLAAMLGAGLHVAQINVPGVELLVSGSIVLFGVLLARKDSLNTWMVASLSAVAGLFHGYAYAESIFGAETTPLVAYLAGFTFIQLVVAMGAWGVGKFVLNQLTENAALSLRFAGFVISGAGSAFLSSIVLNAIFPLPPTS